MKRIFIAGCGYIGERIAALALERGLEADATVRSPERASVLAARRIRATVCSFDDVAAIPPMQISGATLFYLAPPPGGGVADSRVRNFCTFLQRSEGPASIIYMSATSVYGDTGGELTSESSPATPVSAMGKRRLDAENAFRTYAGSNGIPLIILRVSGIYGPGRLPVMQLTNCQPVLCEEEAKPSNRIHADDLAGICLAAAERGRGGDIFNISDGHPSSLTTYFNAVADSLGLPRPPQVTRAVADQVMSPLLLSYFTESRIVDNSRMLHDLGIILRYPTLTEGLPACR